jgi:nitronate monooxygenase/enoyl-[acyl-carrier protein] reductase II
VAALHTPLCDLIGIDLPIIQGSIGPWTTAELPAAVSGAGGLGSVGTALVPPDRLRAIIARVRELTDRPFAVNYTRRPFAQEAFAVGLEARPRVISLAIGDPGDLPARAHEAGALFMTQVHSREQAVTAAEQGADIIIAQGGEAGGFGAEISLMALLPQVVEAVAPLPVVAAGGIADGRGLAAALLLGAQGINIGTRFVAATEAGVPEAYQQAIVAARSDDAVKVTFADEVFPPPTEGGFRTRPRAVRTPFIESWTGENREAAAQQLLDSVKSGSIHELVPFAGQTVGLIDSVEPVATIIDSMVEQAAAILATRPAEVLTARE